ncbi:hypothetical protein I3842_13G097200 [Carya illinoinensis]|uniref:Secreted protein n=1 Tax=Carya illinoinensis TaxID=32201 RepID=A0A922AHU3_CARIL|nr:hypothetical protein I3842_13G097200 [Carya illinoinensis]
MALLFFSFLSNLISMDNAITSNVFFLFLRTRIRLIPRAELHKLHHLSLQRYIKRADFFSQFKIGLVLQEQFSYNCKPECPFPS